MSLSPALDFPARFKSNLGSADWAVRTFGRVSILSQRSRLIQYGVVIVLPDVQIDGLSHINLGSPSSQGTCLIDSIGSTIPLYKSKHASLSTPTKPPSRIEPNASGGLFRRLFLYLGYVLVESISNCILTTMRSIPFDAD